MTTADSFPLVITIGELVVDWIATDKGVSWNQSETFLRSSGGNAANVAHALCRLGTRARLVAKVGDDIHAGYLIETLVAAGVETRFVSRTSAYATAQCYVLTDAAEENSFFNWPKPNACHQLTSDDLPDELFQGASALHATGISLTAEPRSSAVIEAMSRGRASGLLISFDAGFPTGEGDKARELARKAMSLAHIVKVNLPELYFWLADFGEIEDGQKLTCDIEKLSHYGRRLKELTGAQVILLTLGATGSIILSNAQNCFAEPLKVKSLAGVGAGDAYIAAVLSRILASLPEKLNREAHWQTELDRFQHWPMVARFANAAGALATRTISASQGLPTLEEVLALT